MALAAIGALLKQRSEENGCERFEASLALDDIPHLPGIDDTDKALEFPPFAAAPTTNKEDMSTETVSEEVQNMRKARAMCRPLVEYIYQQTGYSFVYKDCRSGRRLKYQHSLRYLCAQREDQDNSKRRSNEKKKAEDFADENGDDPMFGQPTDGDIHAATSAAIAAMVQAAQGIPGDLSALLGDDSNDGTPDLQEYEGSPALDADVQRAQLEAEATHAIVQAAAAAVRAAQGLDAEAEVELEQQQQPELEIEVDPSLQEHQGMAIELDPSLQEHQELVIDVDPSLQEHGLLQAHEQEQEMLQGQEQEQEQEQHQEYEQEEDLSQEQHHHHHQHHEGDMQVENLPDLPVHDLEENASESLAGDDDDDGTPSKKGGRGKGWRRGTGKVPPKVKNPNRKPAKPRLVQKKMERFDCKGSLIININHDGETAYFVISHQLHHSKYVDVVGNRLRGPRFGPVPVNLTATIEAPIGSVEFEGDTVFDKTERALKSMIDLVRDLKNKTGGGEEETVEELYRRTLDARTYRVSIVEALAKGGKTKKEKGEKKARKPSARKRKAEEVEGAVDEGALRHHLDPHELDQQIASGSALLHLGLPADGIQQVEGPSVEQMSDLVALYLDRGTSTDGAWALDPALQRAMGELSET
ncbi:hypothetical protein P7C70_g6569, partial [Phenoliferia sp. Uapishka_3]